MQCISVFAEDADDEQCLETSLVSAKEDIVKGIAYCGNSPDKGCRTGFING